MSEMTKMLHYQTSSGATGACKIYTTEAECPSPNLKVQIDGVLGYVKLSEEENNPDATPIRVHVNSSGKTLKVLKAAVAPTGSITIEGEGEFTVPAGVTVIQVSSNDLGAVNVGVTPGTKHSLTIDWDMLRPTYYRTYIMCQSHNVEYLKDLIVMESEDQEPGQMLYVEWSPEINKLTPQVTDYD